MRNPRYLLFVLLIFMFSEHAVATHIRAGEVVATWVSGRTYRFTFIGYRDIEGVPFGQGVFDFGDSNTYGGNDAAQPIPWKEPVNIGNGVERWEFTLEHTYAGGSSYLVSYREDFRNANIQNISASISTSFYVETLVIVDPLISNSTPVFTVPPIDQGVVGVVFEHNPGAFDPDGDSLSYYFVTPKQGEGINVNGYRSLIDGSFYDNFGQGNQDRNAPPTLNLDPVTGTMVWDSPGGATIEDEACGEFNVAFVVEEWRRVNDQLIRLGFVTRDMQIIICDYENDPPELEIPNDTCVVAGSQIAAIITGTDPDGDPVKVEAFGGPFQLIPSATVDPNPGVFQGPPSILNFEWTPACEQVRSQPYEVQFKATDRPTIPNISNPPGLVDFETWRITVVGPPPTGLVVDTQPGRSIQLDWDSYTCTNADSMQVWRRVGEFDIDPTCNPGIPENSGYQLIKTVGIGQNTYLDNNGGIGLAPGSKYCYRLVAKFPSPAGGLSIASEEACDSLLIVAPVITKVDVTKTGASDGEIVIEWTEPIQRDPVSAPYQYEVLRKEGQDFGGTFTSIAPPSADLSYTDGNLNTEDISYSYQIILYDNTNTAIDTSQQASSVRLEPSSLIGAIDLSWQANVPWSNQSQAFPTHNIYRDNVNPNAPNELVLIGSVDVTLDGFSYLDDGGFNGIALDDETEYCYYVTTAGSYDNELLPEPLLNNSQIICAQPADSIPPCVPLGLNIPSEGSLGCEAQYDCEAPVQQLSNTLGWEENLAPACDDDVTFYRVYISRPEDVEEFVLLTETRVTEYVHDADIFDLNLPLKSLAYCYYITAVDRSGNESQVSEIVCNDNCPQYILPNTFTPNGDFFNDTFRPMQRGGQCPRFVRSVIFRVFNRAGVELFSYDSSDPEKDIFIDWDGTNNAGEELSAGLYYYAAEVRFRRLNPEDELNVFKGWVQIVR